MAFQWHSLDAHQVRPGDGGRPLRSGGKDMLPNDQGQVWQQYDISVYTSQVKGVENPQQAIIDWILRETGTEVWFTSSVGFAQCRQQDAECLPHTGDAAHRGRRGGAIRQRHAGPACIEHAAGGRQQSQLAHQLSCTACVPLRSNRRASMPG